MEVSALPYQNGGIALHGRSPLLRLQSDERLITAIRRGNTTAFEVLLARYQSRLLSFCRHMLGSREDAEDVLQEVMAAAFNAIVADERPINVRPWLYRIARNRSLNHLRKATAIGVDSMDHHFAEHGVSTADKVHDREEFRMLVGDIQDLPETQRTALVLREMDALSYEQIAEAMETTVSSVKSLLVRARMGLAEASEARLLSCEEVRLQLAEVAEGLQKRPGPLVRRHVKECKRCAEFKGQLKATNKALAALLPVGPLVVFKRLAFLHLGHGAASAGAGASGVGAAGSGAGAAGMAGASAAGGAAAGGAAAGGAAAGGAALAGTGAFSGGSLITAGLGAVATKAAAVAAAAAVVTGGVVAVDHHQTVRQPAAPVPSASVPEQASTAAIAPTRSHVEKPSTVALHPRHTAPVATNATAQTTTVSVVTSTGTAVPVAATTTAAAATATTPATATTTTTPPGRVQTQTDPTTLPPTTTTPAPPIGTPATPPPGSTGTTVATTPGTAPPTSLTTPTVPGTTLTTPAVPVSTPTVPVATPTVPVATPTGPVLTPTGPTTTTTTTVAVGAPTTSTPTTSTSTDPSTAAATTTTVTTTTVASTPETTAAP